MIEDTGSKSKTISEQEHEEICLLYQNVTTNLEIFKNRQWYIFMFYSAIAAFLVTQSKEMLPFAKAYLSVALLIGTIVAIFALRHFQQKVSTERKVLDDIYRQFCPLFRQCREIKGDVSKPDTFEKYIVNAGGYVYLIVTFIFVMISFWYTHFC